MIKSNFNAEKMVPMQPFVKEPLINSESFKCEDKICQIKASIAANSQTIGKIGNEELAYFSEQMLIHELIRGSLSEY